MDDSNAKELLELAEAISLIGTWELDLKTNNLVWSDGVFRLCGYERGEFEVNFENAVALIHPEDRTLAIEKMNEAVEKGIPYEIRKRIIRKDKSTIHLLSKGKVISDSKGVPIKLFGVFQDITNTVLLEESYKKALYEHQKVMDSSLDVICAFNLDNQFVKLNAASERVWGYKPEELLGKHYNILVHPDDREITNRTSDKIVEGNNYISFENRNVKKDGTVVPMVWSANFDEKDQLTYCVAKDATQIKQAEEALRLSEQYFKSLVQDGSDLIAILDVEGNYKYVSPTSLSILGMAPEEFIGKNAFSFIHPDDVQTTLTSFENLSIQKRIKADHFRFKHADGTWRWIETVITNLLDDPAVGGIVANSRDITDQKRNEVALEQSHQLLKNAQRITKMGNWEYNCTTKEMFWADEIYQIFEIESNSDKKLTLTDFINFIHPDDLQEFLKAKEQLEKNGEPLNFQHRIITSNNSIKHLKELGERVYNEETKSYWLLATIRDNTEAINAIESLAKSESKYKQLFENNPSPMIIWDFESKKIVDCNAEASYLYGYSKEEFLNLSILDIRPKEDIQLIKDATESERAYGLVHRNIWRHKKKSGELIYVNVTGHLIEFNHRKASLVSLIDVTKQLEAEEQKEFDRRDKEALINGTRDLIWSVNKDLNLIVANQSFHEDLQKRHQIDILPGESIISKEKLPEEILNYWTSLYQTALSGQTIIEEVHSPKTKNYHETWAEVTLNPIYLGDEIIGVACFSRNITEIKLADLEIKKTQENLAEAQRLAKIGSWEFDVKTQKFNWSKETFRIFDIDEATFNKNNNGSFIQFIDPEYQDKALEISLRIKETGENFEMEYQITTPKGKKKTLYEIGYGEKDEEDNVVRFFGTVQDITERKNIENKIIESELKYRSFFENSMDGILLTTSDGQILAANPTACEIFQMEEAEIIKKGRNRLVDTSDPRLAELLQNRQKTGSARGDLTMIRKDGSKFDAELASMIFLDTNGKVRTSMILRDITEKKKNENELIQSNQRFEYAAEATSEAIWDWNLKTNITFYGQGFYKIFGHPDDIRTGTYDFWLENVHPEDRASVKNQYDDIINAKENKLKTEYRFRKADGAYAYVIDRGYVIRDSEGVAIRMVGAMSDITQKKIEEERLKLLESVVTHTNDAVLITEAEPFDLPGPKIVYVNDAFTKMTGYTADEVIGKTPRILQGPDSDSTELERLRKAMRNWESCEVTTINYKKNGEPFWINFTISPVADETGWYTHWIAIERDVTEQKNAQNTLEEALNEKNEILESIGDAFFAINQDWTVTYWNKQAEKMLGISKKNILGNYLWNVFSDRVDSETYIKYHQAMEEQNLVRFEDYFENIDKWYEISIYPSNTGLSVYLKDISERVIYTKAIEERNKKLKEIAYTQSHIVRAPLARILGIVNLIDELKAATAEGKELLTYLNKSANELDDVIKDIVNKTEDI